MPCSPAGEIGRRIGFKFRCPQGRESSSLSPGTKQEGVMRVSIIDIVLCGIVAYALIFGLYHMLGFAFVLSRTFCAALAIAVLTWGNMIHCHPTNPDRPQ